MVSANCEKESYKPLKGPSTPAFTNRDGCLFDLSIPSKDDRSIMTVSILIRVINDLHKSDISTQCYNHIGAIWLLRVVKPSGLWIAWASWSLLYPPSLTGKGRHLLWSGLVLSDQLTRYGWMVLMTNSVHLHTARSSPAEAVGGAAALLRIHRRSPNLGGPYPSQQRTMN